MRNEKKIIVLIFLGGLVMTGLFFFLWRQLQNEGKEIFNASPPESEEGERADEYIEAEDDEELFDYS